MKTPEGPTKGSVRVAAAYSEAANLLYKSANIMYCNPVNRASGQSSQHSTVGVPKETSPYLQMPESVVEQTTNSFTVDSLL